MSLISLGRNAALDYKLEHLANETTGRLKEDEAKADVQKTIDETRRSLVETLTPWIPGDYVATYGVLLTAWDRLQGSFKWMLVIAAASAITFVVLGAFAESGFKESGEAGKKLRDRLIARTIVGFLVSLYASVAIPSSGWYDFKSFTDNELEWITTAGVGVVVLVFVLKGIQKRFSISLETPA